MQIENRDSTSQLSCTGTTHRPPNKSFNCLQAVKAKSSTQRTFINTSRYKRTGQTASRNSRKTCFSSCLSVWGRCTSESARTIQTLRLEPGRSKKRAKINTRRKIEKSLKVFASCSGIWHLKRLRTLRLKKQNKENNQTCSRRWMNYLQNQRTWTLERLIDRV